MGRLGTLAPPNPIHLLLGHLAHNHGAKLGWRDSPLNKLLTDEARCPERHANLLRPHSIWKDCMLSRRPLWPEPDPCGGHLRGDWNLATNVCMSTGELLG